MPGRSDGGAEVEQRHAGYVMLEVEYRGSRGTRAVEGCLLRTALLVQRLGSGGLGVLAQLCLQRFLRPDAVLETTRGRDLPRRVDRQHGPPDCNSTAAVPHFCRRMTA